MCKVVFKEGQYYLVDGSNETQLTIGDFGSGPELKLPENSSNRHYLRLSVFEKKAVNNELSLSYRETRILGERSSSIPKKPDVEWLDDPTDRQTFQILLDKITEAKVKAKEEAKRPLTEKEKLERMIAKYQAKLDNLKED